MPLQFNKHLLKKMGCSNSKYPALSDEDLDFIARNTAITREQVGQQYEHFIARHPDGKIHKKDFKNMMKQGC